MDVRKIQLHVCKSYTNHVPNCVNAVAVYVTPPLVNVVGVQQLTLLTIKNVSSTFRALTNSRSFLLGNMWNGAVHTHLSKPYEHKNCSCEPTISAARERGRFLPLNRGIHNILVMARVSIEPRPELGT